jgi:small subunit ribosomal protein S16
LAVKLRLQRLGRKKRAFYRLVAIDSRKRRDGLEIERLGWFKPVGSKNDNINIKEDRVLHWLEKGAQPSETVHGLFRRLGLNYKWHLMKQGMKGLELDKLIEEWKAREVNRINSKHDKKVKKKELSVVKEESEAPVEEAPAEAAAEEAPAGASSTGASDSSLTTDNSFFLTFLSCLELILFTSLAFHSSINLSNSKPFMPCFIKCHL